MLTTGVHTRAHQRNGHGGHNSTIVAPPRDMDLYRGLFGIGQNAYATGDAATYDKVFAILLTAAMNDSRIQIKYASRANRLDAIGSKFKDDSCLVSLEGAVLAQPADKLSKKALFMLLRGRTPAEREDVVPYSPCRSERNNALANSLSFFCLKDQNWVFESSSTSNPGPFYLSVGQYPSERRIYNNFMEIGKEAQAKQQYDKADQMFAMLFACALRDPKIGMEYQTDAVKKNPLNEAPYYDYVSLNLGGSSFRQPARKLTKVAGAHFLRVASITEKPERPPEQVRASIDELFRSQADRADEMKATARVPNPNQVRRQVGHREDIKQLAAQMAQFPIIPGVFEKGDDISMK